MSGAQHAWSWSSIHAVKLNKTSLETKQHNPNNDTNRNIKHSSYVKWPFIPYACPKCSPPTFCQHLTLHSAAASGLQYFLCCFFQSAFWQAAEQYHIALHCEQHSNILMPFCLAVWLHGSLEQITAARPFFNLISLAFFLWPKAW